jgi:hypothetical protein
VRYDPFDLLFRRVTFEGEIAWGPLPFSLEIAPSYIFGAMSSEFEEEGFEIAARIAWYVQGDALRGFWVKAHAEYENFTATLLRGDEDNGYFGKPGPDCDLESETGKCTRNIDSMIVGLMIGMSSVFGKNGGFALTGGIGIGVALAEPAKLEVQQCTAEDRLPPGNEHCVGQPVTTSGGLSYEYYDGFERIQPIGSLSLGVTF